MAHRLRTAHQVAYTLWCLHEDDQIAGRAPESIANLPHRLRERHPGLDEALIEQGLALFTERLFRESEQRLIGRRRWLAAHRCGRCPER